MEPLFIVGAQRSGTTLLRLILNAHSAIAIPEEGTFWMPLLRSERSALGGRISGKKLQRYIEYIRKNSQFRAWRLDAESKLQEILERGDTTLAELMESVYSLYARSQNKMFWGDKTPSFFRKIDELSQLFPSAKFIHIVRDGRDVFLSMRKREPSRDNIAVAALEWMRKVETASRSIERLGSERGYVITYESLLENPEQEVANLCAFLNIEFEHGMSEFYKSSEKYIGQKHSDLIFQPLSKVSVGKWKAELTGKECRIFGVIAHNCLQKMGYPIFPAGTGNAADKADAFARLCLGLPFRAFQVVWTAARLDVSAKLGLMTDAAGRGSV